MPNYNSINGHIAIHELIFSMTRQCNAFCDICCNSDGPHKSDVINTTYVEKWIQDFVNYIPYCKWAGFTGGEAFLRYNEMLEIHKILYKYGFSTSITTNGYWGNDISKARYQLRQLKAFGLKKIAISMDPSHEVYINPKYASTAAKVALTEGLIVGIASTYKTDKGTAKDYFEPEWHKYIYWDENHNVLPVGRAKSFIKQIKTKEIQDDMLFCPIISIFIQTNGNVKPCCSVCLDDESFIVGNLYKENMPKVLVNMLGDMYLKIITHQGFIFLENIVKKYHKEWNLPSRDYSVCYMCNSIRKAHDFWKVSDAMDRYSIEYLLKNI